ncbi:MAG: UvrD-helicase domain-containing protein [Porticoccaceae bacterium]
MRSQNYYSALAAQLQLHFQQESCCDFTEITLAAQRALGDQDNLTDLTLSLDYRIQHILIDEFQDTSSIQFDILRLLTQGWQIE